MLIDRVYSAVKDFLQKHNVGLIDPSSFNNAANYVQSKIINNLYDEYISERKKSMWGLSPSNYYKKINYLEQALAKLNVRKVLVYDNTKAVFPLPDDLRSDIFVEWNGNILNSVNTTDLLDRKGVGLLSLEEEDFMVYWVNSDGLITVPQLTDVETATEPLALHYFRTPNIVKWAYTTSGNTPIFDENNSVDFDLNDTFIETIVKDILLYLGAEVKDVTTIQAIQGERSADYKEDYQRP